jgi:LPPG:FO 2-phospho-L-lactate transferase
LRDAGVPIIAVTSIIGNESIKGPTAKIMRELRFELSPLSIVQHYHDLIDGFVLDSRDAGLKERINLPVQLCDTLMESLEDRDRVARSVLEFAQQLSWKGGGQLRPSRPLRMRRASVLPQRKYGTGPARSSCVCCRTDL